MNREQKSQKEGRSAESASISVTLWRDRQRQPDEFNDYDTLRYAGLRLAAWLGRIVQKGK